MNVLILGSGGREHAFAWKLAQSPKINKIFIAPGNAGTATCGRNINISPLDFESIKNLVCSEHIEMVLVGPEDPLVHGICDFFLADEYLKNVQLIGPSKHGALLEGSKDFAKDFMKRHHIPTAAYQTFSSENINSALAYLKTLTPPYVIKADGLAAGKGVIICDDINLAENELQQMIINRKFGIAGKKVVIEQFLVGIELSVFVLTDGKSYVILPEAKDYKRIGEGDTGPNTGGMGAVSPVHFADKTFMKKVEEQIVKPTITGLQKDNINYKGFIFIGLMNVNGNPFVIEYNVRMGDPETEVVLPRIKSDFLELLIAIADESLDKINLETDEQSATTVMLVSKGYPENYEKGKIISGLNNTADSIVFHAGTKYDNEGNILTNGGRVLAVTSLNMQMQKALQYSMENAEKIVFEGKYFRKDIGLDLLKF